MVSYLTYYDKELTDDEKSIKIYEETLHNRYKGKTTSRYEYKGIIILYIDITLKKVRNLEITDVILKTFK